MESEPLRLVRELSRCDARVVFAESCTGGLVASQLAQIPGVSQWLCGSAVTYREDTKVNWLGVNPDSLASWTAVSAQVTTEMAKGVLLRTPEASLSAAVTGHLGPDAPDELDGIVFTAVALRHLDRIETLTPTRHQMVSSNRVERQQEAAGLVYQQLLRILSDYAGA